jgi:dTMP kinase
MSKKKGKLIVIDGIDGSGKGTLIQALALYVQRQNSNQRILDLRSYGKKHHSLPQPSELKNFSIIVSSEPTFSLIGRAIRDEIVRDNNREYSALATAQAFALDRYILYKRVIIPALSEGKCVFQERSVTTSICYQPIQKEHLSLQTILKLEGNQLTLKYRPDLLLIIKIKPTIAIKHIRGRLSKNDEAIFEHFEFLKKAQKRFESAWFRKIFERCGSEVAYIDTNSSIEKSTEQLEKIWQSFISKKLSH